MLPTIFRLAMLWYACPSHQPSQAFSLNDRISVNAPSLLGAGRRCKGGAYNSGCFRTLIRTLLQDGLQPPCPPQTRPDGSPESHP